MVNSDAAAEGLEILRERAALYAFLAEALRQQPTLAFLQQVVASLSGEEADEDGALGLLRRFAAGVQASDLEAVQQDLSAEYTRLFLSGRKEGVVPFESVYTSEKKLLMQEAWRSVGAAYQAAGLERDPAFSDPEDHIALELGFMAQLCQWAAEDWAAEPATAQGRLNQQREFLNQHLLVWGLRFAEDLACATPSDFYRGMALLTREHLSQETEIIADLLDALADTQQPWVGR
jgi:TorA maturation chaperone TorD